MSESSSPKECSVSSVIGANKSVNSALISQNVSEELRSLNHLRQELRSTWEDSDRPRSRGSCGEPVNRTVDNKSLRILKFPTFPFIVCEEAPPMYQAPLPYNVEKAVTVLQEEVQALENRFREIEDEEGAIAPFAQELPTDSFGKESGSKKGSKSARRSRERFKLFAEVVGAAGNFADISWDVSVMRWYTRWVASHSISSLQEVMEQLEYVLSEFGMPTKKDMEEAAKQMTFVEAVHVLERDRREVVEFERQRMVSSARTYRSQLPSTAITACFSSYLTAEEKYLYQEMYNQSEHALQLLHHTINVCNGTQAATLLKQNSVDGASVHSACTTGTLSHVITASDTEDVWCLTEAALKAITQERDLIRKLLPVIRSRREKKTPRHCLEEKRRKSRLAALVVYKCLRGDIKMLRKHQKITVDFLSDYDGWVKYRSGVKSSEIIQHMNIQDAGAAPSPHSSNLVSLIERSVNTGRGASYSPPASLQHGQLPRHVEEVCNSYVRLLKLLMEEEGSGEGGDSVKESTYHRWAYLSLRYTCVQIVRGRWPVSILFDCSNEIKKFLLLRLLENCLDGGMVQCQVVELATILNCFLGLVSESAVGELPERECVTFPRSEDCWEAESPTPKLWLLDVPVVVGTAKDIEAMDEASMLLGGSDVVWKYLYGALRFQCVSTENAHGGLSICNVLQVGARKGIHFVGIRAITVPQSVHLASEHGASDVVLKVQYAAHSDKAQQVRSLSQLLKESSASYPLAASDMLRYCYARRVLYVLSLLEQHMVLRDYACSPEEAKWVPLTDILFFSRHVEDESVFAESRSDLDSRRDGRKGNETATWTQRPVTTVGILPPDAVSLMRYNAARADESDAVDRIDGPSPDSLRLMIGSMLMHIATCEQPTLIEMYTIGEATYKQGLQEASKMEEGTLDSGNVTNDSRGFIDRRQGEAAVNGSAKLESISTPILSTIDRYMSSDAFEKVLLKAEVALRRQSAQHLMTTPRSSVARNVPKRRETDMKDKDFSFSPRAMLGSISPGLHGRFSITSPKVLFSQRSGLMSSITTIMSSRSTGNHSIRAAPRLS